jgi:hypothetical protein
MQFLSIRFWLAPFIYYYDIIDYYLDYILMFVDYTDLFAFFFILFTYILFKNLKLNIYFVLFKNFMFNQNTNLFKLPKIIVLPSFFKTILNRFKKFV